MDISGRDECDGLGWGIMVGLPNVLIRQTWMMAVDGMVTGWCMSSQSTLFTYLMGCSSG